MNIASASTVMLAAFSAICGLVKNNTVHAVTLSVNGTNLPSGIVKGNVTLNKRSRKPFSIANGKLTFNGKTVDL